MGIGGDYWHGTVSTRVSSTFDVSLNLLTYDNGRYGQHVNKTALITCHLKLHTAKKILHSHICVSSSVMIKLTSIYIGSSSVLYIYPVCSGLLEAHIIDDNTKSSRVVCHTIARHFTFIGEWVPRPNVVKRWICIRTVKLWRVKITI